MATSLRTIHDVFYIISDSNDNIICVSINRDTIDIQIIRRQNTNSRMLIYTAEVSLH